MFQHFTDRARMAVLEARAEAVESGHSTIGSEHLLIGMLRLGSGTAGVLLSEFGVSLAAVREKITPGPSRAASSPRVDPASALAAIGIDFSAVREAIEASFGKGALRDPGRSPMFTPAAKDVFRHAAEASAVLRHRYIGTEHLLLGVLREEGGLACETLAELGVDLGELARQTRQRIAPEQTRLQESFKRFNDLAVQVRNHGPGDASLAGARALRATVMKDARAEESRAVAAAALRFADRLDVASEQLQAALRAAEAPEA
jgi:ATP-dependent Clp protease ATP-binding subunit ClpA